MNQYGKDNYNKYKYEKQTTKTGKRLKDPVDSNHQGATYGRLCSSQQIFENSEWLKTREAAEYLRTSPKQIRNWVYQGRVTAYKLLGKSLRFKRSELDFLFTKGGQ